MRYRTIWAFLGIVVSATTVLESSLRLYYGSLLCLRQVPLIYQSDQLTGYEYIPDAAGTLCVPSICKTVKINSAGYVGRVAGVTKDPDTLRIVVVDTSNATGFWMQSGDPYPVILESLLRGAGVRAEILNFSIDGKYRDFANVERTRRQVMPYSPDVVLLRISVPTVKADVSRTGYRGFAISYPGKNHSALQDAQRIVDVIERHKFIKELYSNSYIIRRAVIGCAAHASGTTSRLLWGFVNHSIVEDAVPEPLSILETIQLLMSLRNALRDRGADLVFLTYGPDTAVTTVSRYLGVPLVTIQSPVLSNFVHRYDGHYTEPGQRILAGQIFDSLSALPRLRDPRFAL